MQPNIMMTNIMICCVMVGLHAMASKKGGGELISSPSHTQTEQTI